MSGVTDIVVPMLQRLQEDMRNIKVCMSSMEKNQALLNRHMDNFGSASSASNGGWT